MGVRWVAFQPEMTKGWGNFGLVTPAYRYIVKGIFNRLADWLGMAQPNAPTNASYQQLNDMLLGM